MFKGTASNAGHHTKIAFPLAVSRALLAGALAQSAWTFSAQIQLSRIAEGKQSLAHITPLNEVCGDVHHTSRHSRRDSQAA